MRTIGYSTGAIAYGDFYKGIELISKSKANAIELSALRRSELEPLVAAATHLKLSKFRFISVHAPSKFERNDERYVTELLTVFTNFNWPIIVHPDAIHDVTYWKKFGKLMMIENNDKRKPIGQTAEGLKKIFDKLPDARLCFDLAHTRECDGTMSEALNIINNFGIIIGEIHISEVNNSKHQCISNDAVEDFKKVAQYIPKHIPVIIESPVLITNLDDEINLAAKALN